MPTIYRNEKACKIMEDISPIYDNVSIENWAQGIRFIKIRELEDLIEEKKAAIKNTDFKGKDYMSYSRIHLLLDISRLQRKLSFIMK
jgi:hypothetical protein